MSESIQPINMPKWGMSMSEGQVTKWLVAEGDRIAPGTEILEIETDKIANVMESQETGILRRKVANEGETLPVGALLGVVAGAGPTDEEIDAFVQANRVVKDEGEAAGDLTARIQIDGRTIHVMDSGGSAKRAYVLLHGFGGDMNNWLFNFGDLAARARTVAVDLPGHGGSSKDVGDGSVDVLVGTVEGVVDALSLEEVHLVGHSMGGLVAALTALKHPGTVGSLSLLAPAGIAGPADANYIDAFIAAEDRKELKRVLGLLFSDASVVTRDMVNDVLKYKRVDGVPAALKLIANNALHPDRLDPTLGVKLCRLGKPLKILWGADDRIVPPPSSDGLLSALGVMTYDGKGHMLHMEAASDVNAALLAQMSREAGD